MWIYSDFNGLIMLYMDMLLTSEQYGIQSVRFCIGFGFDYYLLEEMGIICMHGL